MTRPRLLPLILLVALAAPACRREAPPAAGQRYPLEGEGRRGRRGQPQGHDRPRGHPRLHARDDHALRRPREGRGAPAARGPRRRDHRHAGGARLALLARGPRGREEGDPRPERHAGAARPRAAAGRRDAGRRPRGPGRQAPAPRRLPREGGGPDLRLHPLPAAGLLPAHDEEVRGRAGGAREGRRASPRARTSSRSASTPRTTRRRCCAPSGSRFQKTTPPFAHWTLATGKEEAIRALGGALELDYVEESRSFTHNLRTAVLDPEGKLRRLFRGNDWTPEELVAELKAAAGV